MKFNLIRDNIIVIYIICDLYQFKQFNFKLFDK